MGCSTVGVIITLALGLLAVPLVSNAQQPATMPRIGALFPVEPASLDDPSIAAFRQALHHLGYVDGQSVTIEYRYGHGQSARFPELVADLVQRKVDVLVIGSVPAALAAMQATQTIPIVFIVSDPVGTGLVASLARPGGNLTGLSFAFVEGFAGKWVELLKEAVPTVSRVAVFRDPANRASPIFLKDMQVAAQALSLTLQPLVVQEPDEIYRAFAAMTTEGVGALIVEPGALYPPHHRRIVDLAAQHRLPVMYGFRVFVDAGGLMSYSVSLADLWRRAATYASKILKGAKAGDLPVEQAMRYELVINLKTAKTLGLTIPPSLMILADEVIQ